MLARQDENRDAARIYVGDFGSVNLETRDVRQALDFGFDISADLKVDVARKDELDLSRF